MSCPNTNGSNSSMAILMSKGNTGTDCPATLERCQAVHTGTIKTPRVFDSEALIIAPVTFPPDCAENTVAVEIVVGRIARKRKPSRRSGSRKPPKKMSMTSTNPGIRIKLNDCTNRCNRHSNRPSSSFSDGRLRPCRMNITKTAILVVSSLLNGPPLAPNSG